MKTMQDMNEKDRNRDFEKYGFKGLDTSATAKEEQTTTCPECSATRSHKHQKTKCCSVNIDLGVWHCHHCNASGYVPSLKETEARTAKQKRIEAQRDKLPDRQKYMRPKDEPGWKVKNLLLSPYSTIKKEKGEDYEPADDELVALLQHEEQRDVFRYLVHERKLTIDTLERAPISLPWWIHKDKVPAGRKDAEGKDIMEEKEMREVVMRFLYYDHRILINQKTRKMDKTFWLHRDAEVIPYNVDAIMRKPVCYITEGEFDVMSLMQAGFPEAISVPTGGSNTNLEWLDRFAETHFEDKQQIFLCTDNDEVGYGMMKELVRRLGGYRCRIVLWDEGCKDANEELQKHGEDGIRKCIERARPVPEYGVETAHTPHVERELDDLFANGMSSGQPIGIDNIDKLITYETGRYMLVTGRPGDGKSEFVDEICLRLCLRQGWKVAYFSPENFPLKYHIAKLMSKLTGYEFRQSKQFTPELYDTCKDWLHQNMCHIMPGGDGEYDNIVEMDEKVDIRQLITSDIANKETFTLDQVLEVARETVVRRGTRILVLDPLNSILRDEKDKGLSDLDWDLEVCNRLLAFAHKNDVLVILVAHPRKVDRSRMNNEKRRVEMNDINGSSKFGAKCDYCLVIDRDDELEVVNAYVDKVKFKHLGTRGSTTLYYDRVSGRYVPCEVTRLTPNEVEKLNQNGLEPNQSRYEVNKVTYVKTIDWRWFNRRWIAPDKTNISFD